MRREHFKCLFLAACLLFGGQSFASISVIDDLGTRLTLEQPATRIVTLSPHLTELVFEAGAQHRLVATVDFADYPETTKQIGRVGSYNTWDIEKIVAMQPDVVLVWLSAKGINAVKRLRDLGLKVYVSEPRALADISRTIRDIGSMAGTQSPARKKAQQFDAGIAQLRNKYQKSKKVRVFYQVWKRPLITINNEQLISQVFNLCGGENVFADLQALAPVVSTEALLQANPQLIIGGAREDEKQDWLSTWKKWPTLEAVKQDNLYFINPDLLSRQSSRMLQGAQQVCEILEQVRNKGTMHD